MCPPCFYGRPTYFYGRPTEALAQQQKAEQIRTDALMAEIRSLKSQVAPPSLPEHVMSAEREPTQVDNAMFQQLMERLSGLEKSMKANQDSKAAEDAEHLEEEEEGDPSEHIVTPDGKTVLLLEYGVHIRFDPSIQTKLILDSLTNGPDPSA